MWTKIEHIGIAVNDIEEITELYENLSGLKPYKMEEVESEKVKTYFYKIGESKLEFLVPTSEDSTIHKFLKKRGSGFHHIAFEVEDVAKEVENLSKKGARIIYPELKDGADNKKICFVHPQSTQGLLIELCQSKQD